MLMIVIAIVVLSLLSLVFGWLLGYADQRFTVPEDPVAERLENLLPQSQCGQCGFPGCRPYAQAIVSQGAKINLCAPGGEAVMQKLATVLNVAPQPLDDAAQAVPIRQIARIDEANCIGCTKCIQACPVDAIVGTTRAMHTVIESLCTGCDLCIAPCPTNCITLQPVTPTTANWKWDLRNIAVRTVPVDRHV